MEFDYYVNQGKCQDVFTVDGFSGIREELEMAWGYEKGFTIEHDPTVPLL